MTDDYLFIKKERPTTKSCEQIIQEKQLDLSAFQGTLYTFIGLCMEDHPHFFQTQDDVDSLARILQEAKKMYKSLKRKRNSSTGSIVRAYISTETNNTTYGFDLYNTTRSYEEAGKFTFKSIDELLCDGLK